MHKPYQMHGWRNTIGGIHYKIRDNQKNASQKFFGETIMKWTDAYCDMIH